LWASVSSLKPPSPGVGGGRAEFSVHPAAVAVLARAALTARLERDLQRAGVCQRVKRSSLRVEAWFLPMTVNESKVNTPRL
jgi:hypothetical protein